MKDVRIVNLASYTAPRVVERKHREWVEYGDDNNYFQYLIDRYNGSATNNAIINGMAEMIYGKGIAATDASRRPDQYAQMVSLFSKDCMRKVVFDLKLMGQASMQIIYSKDRKSIAQVEHFPIETLRLEKCNENGDIEGYYYHKDWTKIKPSDKPKRIPAFGTSNEAIEIYCIKPYKTGYYYYSPVDYQGGLQYAELEEEIANYHLNNIKNGLAPSMLINFNNGIPNEEERSLIERRIYEKFSGSSNAGKFILAFNDNSDAQANIEPVQLSDAHNQYQFLSDESSKKILVSHRIVSPMLFGIKDQTGLGNNADELRTASTLTDNVVVRPFQQLIIDAMEQILAFNGITLNLYFKTLQPLEFTDLKDKEDQVDDETIEEETGVKQGLSLSKQDAPEIEGIAEDLIQLGDSGESMEGWELVDEMDVDYDMEEKLDKMIGLASTGSARPSAKSEQDKNIEGVQFKVRYKYSPDKVSKNSREFCKKMVAANKLYRKEDILQMDDLPVNAGWGPNGADTYSIWKFKGGGLCHHRWRRMTFRFTGLPQGQGDPNSALAPKVGTKKAEEEGMRVRNPKEVSKKPKDMPNEGFLKPRKK